QCQYQNDKKVIVSTSNHINAPVCKIMIFISLIMIFIILHYDFHNFFFGKVLIYKALKGA
ncbi:hypothetical protein, partial [Klebsiella variicola]|uniref:hypothetical protein n=1 Tax=Klebsiella variicola TaxID=244366 RepID=UPI0038D20FE3